MPQGARLIQWGGVSTAAYAREKRTRRDGGETLLKDSVRSLSARSRPRGSFSHIARAILGYKPADVGMPEEPSGIGG